MRSAGRVCGRTYEYVAIPVAWDYRGEVTHYRVVYIESDSDLDRALNLMEEYGADELPIYATPNAPGRSPMDSAGAQDFETGQMLSVRI